MGKKKQEVPPPPPTWSDTWASYTAYAADTASGLADSASKMLYSVTGSSGSSTSTPPNPKTHKASPKKPQQKAMPTPNKQKAQPRKNRRGDKQKGAQKGTVPASSVLVDSLTKYSDNIKTIAADSTARARAHAGAVKIRALETSRRSTARVGVALGRDDLHEHAAAVLVVLLVVLVGLFTWLYRRLGGVGAGRSKMDLSASAASAALGVNTAAPEEASAAQAQAPAPSGAVQEGGASFAEALAVTAEIKATVASERGAVSAAPSHDAGVGVADTSAELTAQAIAVTPAAAGVEDGVNSVGGAVFGGDISVASDAATAGTDVDIDARAATVDDPGAAVDTMDTRGAGGGDEAVAYLDAEEVDETGAAAVEVAAAAVEGGVEDAVDVVSKGAEVSRDVFRVGCVVSGTRSSK